MTTLEILGYAFFVTLLAISFGIGAWLQKGGGDR